MGRGGRRNQSDYVYITAEVFFDPERNRCRVRPIAGEVYPTARLIECSNKIHNLPIGTRIRLKVVETEKEDGRKFLYSSYKWNYELVPK